MRRGVHVLSHDGFGVANFESGDNRPFMISVMTAYDRDERAAERAISEIAFEAYGYFEMRGKASEYGRVLPPQEKR